MTIQSLNRGVVQNYRRWTPEEDAVLKACFPKRQQVLRALPHRTQHSVQQRALRLGLVARRRWTLKDDELLRELWDPAIGGSLQQIAKALGRTPGAVHSHAVKDLLLDPVPEGYERISVAAERTGLYIGTLKRALKGIGAEIYRAYTVPTRGRSYQRGHVVLVEDADEAVEWWLSTEPVEQIAKRLGIAGTTLRARLRRAGLRGPGRHILWRMRQEDVERIMKKGAAKR